MKKTLLITGLACLILGICIALSLGSVVTNTSSAEYCMSCHYHEQADADWKKSEHFVSKSGVVTSCTECHLPPPEDGFFKYHMIKSRTGAKHMLKKLTTSKEDIDWEAMRDLDHATRTVYNESCVKCHANLYPEGISDDGITAHLYYEENASKLDLNCISCHLNTGHYMPGYEHKRLEGKVMDTGGGEIFDSPAEVTSFGNFTETVPGTTASIKMVAVPGGEFTLGSPDGEAGRSKDEGPCRKVRVSPFFMGETEVTWSQFWSFYNETMSEGRTPPEKIYANNSRPDVDAVSGPTPPFGLPDQGWGMGERPAITMTHYAAETFCQWLSLKTGRRYRLPTEAEWEYAARGGTSSPYFFEGDPKQFRSKRFGKTDTTTIARYVVYSGDSGNRTGDPSSVKANPFGLKNMLGNVMEYCSDRYAEDAYSSLVDGVLDPKGPSDGSEYVVRGGSYSDDASRVRCAARDHTRNDEWLRTDPQNPKSIWWYSDVKGIGFRVVCEVPKELKR